MNTPATSTANPAVLREFIAHVMNQAKRPEMLPAVVYPTLPMVLEEHSFEHLEPRAATHVAKCLARAHVLRERIRIQSLAALSVLASPLLVDESKLFDVKSQTRRKPRVVLWCEQGEDEALNFFWRALRPDHPDMPMDDPGYCEGTDYISMGTVPAFHEDVPDNQILRLEKGEFLENPGTRNSATRPLAATWEFARSLDESLRHMLEMLGTFCDITLETWPHYDSGELYLLDAADRGYDILCYALEEAQQQLSKASSRGEQLAKEFGFDDFDECRALIDTLDEKKLRDALLRKRGAGFTKKQYEALMNTADVTEALQSACVSFGETIAYMEKELMDSIRNGLA